VSLLESLIKTQREETDKKLEAIRTSLSAQEATAKAEEKAKHPGALEVTLVHKAELKRVRISIDQDPPVEFLGQVWSKLNIDPGQHVLSIRTISEPEERIERVVEVAPSGVARIEVKLSL
jgi:hypothetical protein